MANSANIVIGPATIYLNGVDIGFTQGGATISNAREYVDVKADQAVGTVKKGRSDEMMKVSFTLLEITLEVLRIAWDQPTANISGNGYYYLGYQDSCSINTHTLKLIGKGPGCNARSFYFYECIQIGDAEYSMSRENATTLEVEFEVLKSSANGNKFGWVLDG